MTKRFLTLLMLSLFITSGSAFAADIDLGEGYHVSSGFSNILITSSDGTAIQNAVENIADGGTISLSGDFKLKNGSINIKKNLTLQGVENGRAVLDRTDATKQDRDRVIRCEGNITLKNLTIIGGYSSNGGGIKLDKGKVKIISCDINGNTAVLGGGGIHSQAETLELVSCDISKNTSMLAGGGLSSIGGTITMTDCNITQNEATNLYGGGLGLAGSKITMTNCNVTNNKAEKSYGGGIALIDSEIVTSKDCEFLGNTASTDLTADIYDSKSSN
ncbi:MAG: hypothetical protein IJ597_01760 [Synergistaceae bacterium]|nr:hypothetical protein [Synergistaceae bacterium]